MRMQLAIAGLVVLGGASGAYSLGSSDLRLEVVDISGIAQARVPLRLVLRARGSAGGDTVVLWRGFTGLSDGQARVPGPADRPDCGCWRDLARAGTLVVEIPLRSWRTFERGLTADQVGSGRPLRLVIPRTGTVSARVVDRRHRPVEAATVKLFGAAGAPPATGYDWRLLGEEEADGTGAVAYDHVEVGQELMLFAQGKDGRWQPAETTGPAPFVAGGEAFFLLHFRDPNTYFRTTLLGPDGQPLHATEVYVDQRVDGTSVVDAAGGMPGVSRMTDADGRLTVTLDRSLGSAAGFALVFSRRDPDDVPGYAVPTEQARLELIDRVERGRVHLGEVRLEKLPVAAAGRVVRPDGRPVEAAVVTVFEAVPAAGPMLNGLGIHSQPHPATPGLWLEPRFRTSTRADGTFRVFGAWRPAEWFVAASYHLRPVAAPAPFALGDHGLRFVVPEEGVR